VPLSSKYVQVASWAESGNSLRARSGRLTIARSDIQSDTDWAVLLQWGHEMTGVQLRKYCSRNIKKPSR